MKNHYKEEGEEAKISDDLEARGGEDKDEVASVEEAAEETIKKLREKLKKAVAEKQEYLTGWQRDRADFLNARKRDKEEREQFLKFASESLIVELLPVLQSFEMAFNNKDAWEKVDPNWRKGVEHIYQQFKTTLETNGLKEIYPLGQKFDPTRDEVAEYITVIDEKGHQTIESVVQKGYALHGKVILPPKVKVGEYKKS